MVVANGPDAGKANSGLAELNVCVREEVWSVSE